MGKVIAVASGKGGTGKTSFCANVAASLCAMGEKVLLIDADAGLRSLDLVLGMTGSLLFSYADVIDGAASLKNASVAHATVKNLRVLTAPGTPRVFKREELAALLKRASEHFTYTIVDCPAGISGNVIDFCVIADSAIVVCTPDEISLRTGQKVGMLLADRGQTSVKIAVNRVRSDMINRGDAVNIDAAMDKAGLSLCGVIPEDKKVMACGNAGKLLILERKSPAARAYYNIAERLRGIRTPVLSGIKGRF